MKKKLLWVLSLCLVLALGGCMFFDLEGDVYGAYSSDGTIDYLSLSGFPNGTVYEGSYYNTGSGTFEAYYRTYYSGLYYPGNAGGTGGLSTAYYWHYTYSVSGQFLEDIYYWLYLDHDGFYTLGVDSSWGHSAKSMAAPAGLGSHTYQHKNLTVTVTGEIVQLSPEELARLAPTTFVKK